MKRKKYILVSFLNSMMVACCFAQAPVKVAVIDKLYNAQSATMGGFIGEKLNASYENRILAQDINRLVEPLEIVLKRVVGKVNFGESGLLLLYLLTGIIQSPG